MKSECNTVCELYVVAEKSGGLMALLGKTEDPSLSPLGPTYSPPSMTQVYITPHWGTRLYIDVSPMSVVELHAGILAIELRIEKRALFRNRLSLSLSLSLSLIAGVHPAVQDSLHSPARLSR